MTSSPLSSYEEEYLAAVRALVPGEPPVPWRRAAVVSAAGVIAGGWTADECVLVVSHDGYSVTDALTGVRLVRDPDSRTGYGALSRSGLSFRLPASGETVAIFGIYGGGGILHTEDGWDAEILHPWWPRSEVALRTPFVIGSGQSELARSHLLSLQRLEPARLWCGFSPSGRHLLVLGSAGAEVFTR